LQWKKVIIRKSLTSPMPGGKGKNRQAKKTVEAYGLWERGGRGILNVSAFKKVSTLLRRGKNASMKILRS